MVTFYCVGDYPRDDNSAYWVVQHSSGYKRWCWTSWYRDEMIRVFEDCEKDVRKAQSIYPYATEETLFGLAMLGRIESLCETCGFPMDEHGKGGHYYE